jgi:hypothetical protein
MKPLLITLTTLLLTAAVMATAHAHWPRTVEENLHMITMSDTTTGKLPFFSR